MLRSWILNYRHANVKDIAHKLDWWVYQRLTCWLQQHHDRGFHPELAEYEYHQYGRRRNLEVRDGQGRSVFLYEMSDLPLKHYRTHNYPYTDAQLVVTQTEGEAVTFLRAIAGQGGTYRTLRATLTRRIPSARFQQESPGRHLQEWNTLAENRETAQLTFGASRLAVYHLVDHGLMGCYPFEYNQR